MPGRGIGGVDRELTLAVAPEAVWAAVADPERLGAWLGAAVEVDLHPGASASFRMEDGEHRRGMVLDVVDGRRLSFTWWPVGGAGLGDASTVTITVDPGAGGGSVVRVHEARARARARRRVTGRDDRLRRAEAVLGVLGDATRRDVLGRIASGEPTTATELARDLPVTRQAVVKHLHALNEAGLVAPVRTGREVRYSLTPAPLEDAVGWIVDIGAQWDRRLDRLRAQLEARARTDG